MKQYKKCTAQPQLLLVSRCVIKILRYDRVQLIPNKKNNFFLIYVVVPTLN